MTSRLFLGVLMSIMLLAGCDKPASPPPVAQDQNQNRNQTQDQSQNQIQPKTAKSPGSRGTNVRFALFLNRMRSTNPDEKLIQKAMINEQNEIGVILDPSIEADKVTDVMKTIVGRMATEFPGENLTVHAYAASDAANAVGVAKLDAQSGEVTYTPAVK